DRIKYTILALVTIASLIYLVITFLPWIFPACPLQTPITEGTPWIRRPMVRVQWLGSSIRRSESEGYNTLKEFVALYHELRSIPEPQELQAQILAWVISSTLDEKVLKEALKALAGKAPTIPNAGPNLEERRRVDLYPLVPHDATRDTGYFKRELERFSLRIPLACVLRLHILMNCNADDADTNWQGDILGLIKTVNDPSFSWMQESVIFRGDLYRTDDRPGDIRALSHQLGRSNSHYLASNWTRDYMTVPQSLCKLCLDEDSGVREGAIEALMRTSADHQLCLGFESAFEELVTAGHRDQTPRILAAMTAFVQDDNLRKHMKRGTTLLMKLVENEQHECWDSSVPRKCKRSLVVQQDASLHE
ncbi:10919_t:CDS:2, partial [Acaulospora colombiana]